MKLRLFLVPAVCLSLLVFSAVSASSQTVLTFDDIFSSNPPSGLLITNGYQGLNWVNFGVLNVPLTVQNQGITGYYYGMASASNVAVNGFGKAADIVSPVTNFNFVSAYLTGAFNSNLNIEVQGFSGSNILYDETVVAGATNRTLFTFNYSGIDRLHFNAFGGQLAFGPALAENFVMDNFTFEFVPEPSPLLLTAVGLLALRAFVKRRRT